MMNNKGYRILVFALIISFVVPFFPITNSYLNRPVFAQQPSLKFPWPITKSSTVSQGYTQTHQGIDFDFLDDVSGDFVLAAQAGTVVTAYNDGGYHGGAGNFVKIDHGNNYYTVYQHMALGTVRVRPNQYVAQGQILGEVGCTGRCWGDHLHFELWHGSEKIRPTFTECNCVPQERSNYTSQNDIYNPLPGDINVFIKGACGDGTVNALDYTVLYDNFNEAPTDHPCADINADRKVNILDYVILFNNWGETLSSSTNPSESKATPLAIPNPPSNVLITSESNVLDTYVLINMSWDDNSNDETGFTFTWNIEDYDERSITQINDTPPAPPEETVQNVGISSSNNTQSVLALLPCGETNSTRSVSASVSAFNASGSSPVALGTGIIEIPACPVPGDANGDRKVDGFDYVIWWQNFSQTTSNGHRDGDFNYDGIVDGIDYVIWWLNFGYSHITLNNAFIKEFRKSIKIGGIEGNISQNRSIVKQGDARIYFDPSAATIPPNTTFKLVLDSLSYPIVFVNFQLKFDPSLIRLLDEIQTANVLGTVIRKSSKDEANSTGTIDLIMALPTENQPPTGLLEIASLPFGLNSTSLHQFSELLIEDQAVQIVDFDTIKIPFISDSAVILVNPIIPNDYIDFAKIIDSTPYADYLDTTNATSSPDDPLFSECSRSAGLATVWYKYTPSTSGILKLSTFGSNYNTILGVWKGSKGNLTLITCNDDFDEGLQSYLEAGLRKGITYYIEVAQYQGVNSKVINGYNSVKPQAGGLLELKAEFTSCSSVIIIPTSPPRFTCK